MTDLLLYLVGTAILVVVLSVLRSRMVFELSAASMLLFGKNGPGVILYSIIMLPGTIVHELSHWLVAEILRVPTGEITILPEKDNLGSVATGTTDPFRGLLIGAAPFLTGLGILIVLSSLVRDWWGTTPWWQVAFLIYGMMVMGNSMLVSSADRRNWPIAIGVILILAVVLWNLGIQPSEKMIKLITEASKIITYVLLLTATLNLGTIGFCTAVRKGIERISHKKVIIR